MEKIGILTRDIDVNGGCENVSKQLYLDLKKQGRDVMLISLNNSVNTEYVSVGVKDNIFHHVRKSVVDKVLCTVKSVEIKIIIIQIDSPLSLVFTPELIIELTKLCRVYCVFHNSPKSYVRYYGLNHDISIRNIFKSGKIILYNIPLIKKRFEIIKEIKGITFVTISGGARRELLETFGIEARVVYNPLTTQVIDNDIKNRPHKALYMGRMDNYQKNICEIIDAWNKINKKDWSLSLVGKGKDYKYIRHYIKKNKVKQIEIINGIAHDQAMTTLRQSSIVLLFSNYEGFPTVINEAMANGAAVVTSRYDGFADEIYKDGYNCMVSDNSVESFGGKIQQLIDNPNKIEELALGGFKTYLRLKGITEQDQWGRILKSK